MLSIDVLTYWIFHWAVRISHCSWAGYSTQLIQFCGLSAAHMTSFWPHGNRSISWTSCIGAEQLAMYKNAGRQYRGGCGNVLQWMVNGLDTATWCLGKLPRLSKNHQCMWTGQTSAVSWLHSQGVFHALHWFWEAYSEQWEWQSVLCASAPQQGEQ